MQQSQSVNVRINETCVYIAEHDETKHGI